MTVTASSTARPARRSARVRACCGGRTNSSAYVAVIATTLLVWPLG